MFLISISLGYNPSLLLWSKCHTNRRPTGPSSTGVEFSTSSRTSVDVECLRQNFPLDSPGEVPTMRGNHGCVIVFLDTVLRLGSEDRDLRRRRPRVKEYVTLEVYHLFVAEVQLYITNHRRRT